MTATSDSESPLSLRRLRNAFAAMLSPGTEANRTGNGEDPERTVQSGLPDPCEIGPRSLTEALLFVGRPEDACLSARELAAAMRGISPSEIDDIVVELNKDYERDGAPYCISGMSHGYRLVLREEFRRVREKLVGRIREARLTPSALEVLSVVAYNQPVTGENVARIRNRASGPLLAMLVRRRLLKLKRQNAAEIAPSYVTTDRFLRLFNLENLDALPRSEELAAAGIP